jgi:lysophospholipase L1-like esterase
MRGRECSGACDARRSTARLTCVGDSLYALAVIITLLFALALAAPATRSTSHMAGESLVLVGTEPARLIATNVDPASVVVRSTYSPGGTAFEAGKDFVLDPAAGTIARTKDSRIPDFATNILYGKQNFDHSKFPGYGNLPFTVYVDYDSPDIPRLVEPTDQTTRLAKTRAKLQAGGPFKVVSFGDSITNGGEASTAALQFASRYAAYLGERFPKAQVTIENGATGGDTTISGMPRLQEKVLSRKPDLVLVGFGMNDHNHGGPTTAQFQKNLEQIVNRIHEKTGADVILFSAFPPNPLWAYGTHRMQDYAAATKAAADATGVAYADVYSMWAKVLERKNPESLLANNINHPNDFGHWLYFEALKSVGF